MDPLFGPLGASFNQAERLVGRVGRSTGTNLTHARQLSISRSTLAGRENGRSRTVKWAGWLITLAGIAHTAGSLIETAPDHLGTWFDGSLWSETGHRDLSDAAAGFWYSALSFGPPLLLIGVTVLWMERRGITPPTFIAWAVASWVIATFVASGPSPLPVLLVASGLLLVAARRSATHDVVRSVETDEGSA